MYEYLPIALVMLAGLVMAGGMILFSYLLGPKKPTGKKTMPYECGVNPQGNARQQFSISFYMIAMLFILFDVEVIFLYPWAVVFLDMSPRLYGFIAMVIFLFILIVGFLYEWKRGALEWD